VDTADLAALFVIKVTYSKEYLFTTEHTEDTVDKNVIENQNIIKI